VIWVSILGVLPFSLLLPHVGLFWTEVLSVVIALVLSSAFAAILVYAQELMPGRVGMVAGMFFGFAFGMGGIGAALLGELADHHEHRLRLSGLCLPAGTRAADGCSCRTSRGGRGCARLRRRREEAAVSSGRCPDARLRLHVEPDAI
jgi:hypothetical protein